MDQMLSEKMKALLADPDAMARMMDMAGKLFSGMGSDGGEEKKEQGGGMPLDGAALAGVASMLKGISGGDARMDARMDARTDSASEKKVALPATKGEEKPARGDGVSDEDRIRLIGALCPYLNPARREAAQAMIRILKLMSMANSAGLLGRAN